MIYALFVLLSYSQSAIAACTTLPGRDGHLAATICTPDTPASPPLSSWGSGGPWGGHGSSHNPIYTSPPVISSPQVVPTWPTSSPNFKLPTVQTPSAPPAMMSAPDLSFFKTTPLPEAPPPGQGAVAEGVGAILAFRASALWQSKKSAIEYMEIIKDWHSKQVVEPEKIHGELMQYIDQQEAALQEEQAAPADKDGIVVSGKIPNSTMRYLRERIAFKSGQGDIGFKVRAEFSHILWTVPKGASQQVVEQAAYASALLVAADAAAADGMVNTAESFLRVAVTTFDLAIGLVPGWSSVNDASQITLGLMTGYDLAGNRMERSDYALRSVGVVLGLLPAGGIAIRFGSLMIDRTSLFMAHAYRRMTFTEVREFVMPALQVLRNEAGGVGSDLSRILRYQNAFAGDPLKFKHMMAALERFNEFISVSNRKLMQHPSVAGLLNADALRATFRTNASRDTLAEETVFKMLQEGERIVDAHQTLNIKTYNYIMPNGFGVRFDVETGRFITFTEPKR